MSECVCDTGAAVCSNGSITSERAAQLPVAILSNKGPWTPITQSCVEGVGPQGCAGWARNPKGPQITPFCHQLGRHPTVLDATSADFRQISARRSLGGSRPLNLNFFFTILEPKNAQMSIFVIFLKIDTPSRGGFGRIWAPRGPRGPKGAQGAHGAPWAPMGAPMGAQGAPWAPWGPAGGCP